MQFVKVMSNKELEKVLTIVMKKLQKKGVKL